MMRAPYTSLTSGSDSSRAARAWACAPPATAMSQYTSSSSPTDSASPVKRFRMEVVRVYLNLYTDR